jgi:hypothetical protein
MILETAVWAIERRAKEENNIVHNLQAGAGWTTYCHHYQDLIYDASQEKIFPDGTPLYLVAKNVGEDIAS